MLTNFASGIPELMLTPSIIIVLILAVLASPALITSGMFVLLREKVAWFAVSALVLALILWLTLQPTIDTLIPTLIGLPLILWAWVRLAKEHYKSSSPKLVKLYYYLDKIFIVGLAVITINLVLYWVETQG